MFQEITSLTQTPGVPKEGQACPASHRPAGFLVFWHRVRAQWAVLLFPAMVVAQTADLSPDVLLLSKAMRHIREGILAVPNYTCLETIARDRLPPHSPTYERLDLVRLEVVKQGRRELFAWPGARKFDDRPVTDFTGGGLMGNGTFALFADDLFVNRAASMKVRGAEKLNGRALVRIDYSVRPIQGGTLTLTTAWGSAELNYSGSWWVDPATLNLVRLDIAAEDIPAQLHLSSARIGIEYGEVSDATLPQTAVIEFTKDSGEVSRDAIEFTRCRKFSGDAQLVFAETEPAPDAGHASSVATLLPGGLSIPLRIETAIDPASAGIGDEILATVEKDVRDKQRLWLPRGSVVRGRIRRLAYRDQGSGYELVGLEFTEAEVAGDRFDFVVRLETAEPAAGIRTTFGARELTQTAGKPGIVESQVTEFFEREMPGVGYLYLTAAPYRVPGGLHMIWKTETVRQGSGG